MDVLTRAHFFFRLVVLVAFWAGDRAFAAPPSAGWQKPPHVDHCHPTREFTATRDFLRDDAGLELAESEIRRMAYRVSETCGTPSKSFRNVFETLTKSGVDHRFALNAALEMAGRETRFVRVFLDGFKRLYLEEYLDVSYANAYRTARELAEQSAASAGDVGEDFVDTVDFCLDAKGLSQSKSECLRIAMHVARQTRYFPQGSFAAFRDFYQGLLTDAAFSREKALEIALKVLPHGPTAPENFRAAYRDALKDGGFGGTNELAIRHALKLASLSHRGETPPVIERP